MAKTPSVPPEPSSNDSDLIDQQIASLLKSVSSKGEGHATVQQPDVRPDRGGRVARSAVARPELPPPRRRARRSPRRTLPRPRRFAPPRPYELPRPYLSYTVRHAFSVIAIVLCSVAFAFLIVYLFVYLPVN